MSHLNTTKTASVSDDVYWQPIDEFTPRGVKLQLISDKYGVAQYGTLQTGQVFFTHWQDLPRFKTKEKEIAE